ncbi:MAG: TPM domain-containing protein [Oscillospiraceae bacterium]|nr:TPM domain-containing protein [Oscillospiraceae bacterium]
MKKRMFSLVLLLCLAFSLAVPAFAFQDYDHVYTAVDQLGSDMLEQMGTQSIPLMLDSLKFDIRVDIVDDLEGSSIDEYAGIFYEKYEYGYGDNHDGMLLMAYVTDHGDSVTFNEYTLYGVGKGAEQLGSSEVSVLRSGLDMYLTGDHVDYDTAAASCSSAVGLFVGTMTTLNNTGDMTAVPADENAVEAIDLPEENDTEEPETPEAVAPAEEPEEGSDPEETGVGLSNSLFGTASAPFVVDDALLLTQQELDTLEEKAEDLAFEYDCGVYVLTVDSLDGKTPRDFAQDYYWDYDLGIGEGQNGIMFLVAMDSRDYITITYGKDPTGEYEYGIGIRAFSDFGIEKMEEQVVPLLSDGDYNGAFTTYMDVCQEYLEFLKEEGHPYDVNDGPKNYLVRILIVIFAPLAIAGIVCGIFFSQMKTAKMKTEARDYIDKDSFQLTSRNDRYIRTTVTRTKIEKNNSSSGGSGGSGGSTVNSSGFGGSKGGKF